MRKSIRNLAITTGIVALSSYIVLKVVNSKKGYVIDKGDMESLKNNDKNGSKTSEKEEIKPRKYHTLYLYKKSPIEK